MESKRKVDIGERRQRSIPSKISTGWRWPPKQAPAPKKKPKFLEQAPVIIEWGRENWKRTSISWNLPSVKKKDCSIQPVKIINRHKEMKNACCVGGPTKNALHGTCLWSQFAFGRTLWRMFKESWDKRLVKRNLLPKIISKGTLGRRGSNFEGKKVYSGLVQKKKLKRNHCMTSKPSKLERHYKIGPKKLWFELCFELIHERLFGVSYFEVLCHFIFSRATFLFLFNFLFQKLNSEA